MTMHTPMCIIYYRTSYTKRTCIYKTKPLLRHSPSSTHYTRIYKKLHANRRCAFVVAFDLDRDLSQWRACAARPQFIFISAKHQPQQQRPCSFVLTLCVCVCVVSMMLRSGVGWLVQHRACPWCERLVYMMFSQYGVRASRCMVMSVSVCVCCAILQMV